MEIKKGYWPNGQLQYEYQYKNGKEHGIHKRWYESGRLGCEFQYQNGKAHGVRKWWYRSGQLIEEYYYIHGKRVSKKEFRRYELITKLAGISDE